MLAHLSLSENIMTLPREEHFNENRIKNRLTFILRKKLIIKFEGLRLEKVPQILVLKAS